MHRIVINILMHVQHLSYQVRFVPKMRNCCESRAVRLTLLEAQVWDPLYGRSSLLHEPVQVGHKGLLLHLSTFVLPGTAVTLHRHRRIRGVLGFRTNRTSVHPTV